MKQILFLALVFVLASCGRDPGIRDSVVINVPDIAGKLYRVETGKEVTPKEFFAEARNYPYIVLGEKHYTETVQAAQAKIIEGVVNRDDLHIPFAVGWEFLNYTDQAMITSSLAAIKKKESTWEKFLDTTQGAGKGRSYLPILQIIEKEGGELLGTNLPREKKKEITAKGVKDADPALFPSNFELGGPNYHERFKEAMGDGHGMPIENLFAAQSVTDSWLAESLVTATKQPLHILVNGSFHSDYRDGVIAQLKRKLPAIQVLAIRLVQEGDEEANPKNWKHSKYGNLADFIVVTK